MKRKGFTLAEVLVTLGIIGVVAALTIATLVNNAQNQANASKLSSTVSTLENAFGVVLTNDETSPMELHDIDFQSKDMYSRLTEFLKTSGKVSPSVTYSVTVPSSLVFMLKSGAIVYLGDSRTAASGDDADNVDYYYGPIYIDVNGEAKPNKLGKDLFSFNLGEDGNLYPSGTETTALVKNGYKIE